MKKDAPRGPGRAAQGQRPHAVECPFSCRMKTMQLRQRRRVTKSWILLARTEGARREQLAPADAAMKHVARRSRRLAKAAHGG